MVGRKKQKTMPAAQWAYHTEGKTETQKRLQIGNQTVLRPATYELRM